ncbi:hypothetical protein QTI24_06570 [Variovorax sp. J22P240]|uniref:hypothetical protein n=1 Tax=Variovorax sp. J22P240 TaxID=3053514 RepID=UPI00257750A6|nr:hypothetical protein [Variovorax sp. J22P240]MDL9998259.1 hypothetical protein [Variovorax sp. J22P240]
MNAALAVRAAPERPVARLLRAAGVVATSGATGLSVKAAFLARHDGERDASGILRTVDVVARGHQPVAMSSTPEWAGVLVSEDLVALFDLLGQHGNAFVQLPVVKFEFANRGKLRIPTRVPGKSLGGAFRKEGEPIRVGALSLSSKSLEPRSLAVLASATTEMVEAAGDDVLAELIRVGAISDTSRTIDSLIFDSLAGDDARPPGLGYGVDTAVATGVDAAAIAADLRGRLDVLLAAGYGNPATTRWVMRSGSATTLTQIFLEMQVNRTFLGLEVVSSPDVPPGQVMLLDGSGVAIAADPPRFESASGALLHEEADASAVAEDVSAAVPLRSGWQTAVTSFRLIWPMNWCGATGAIAVLTGVLW